MQMRLTDSQIQDDSRSVSDDMVGTSPQMPHVALLHNSDGETSVRSQHSIDTESVSSEDSVMVIPSMWRPSIMSCIKQKKLTIEARNEIVRDLCTHMYGHMKLEVEKPTTVLPRLSGLQLSVPSRIRTPEVPVFLVMVASRISAR